MSSRLSNAAFDQPPSMRMPNELLDEIFEQVFAELEHEPLRSRVRVYAPLSLVCKAWQRVAVTHAYANLVVDAAKDSDAIAFLDPVGGAGAHLLPLVKSLHLSAPKPLAQLGESGKEDQEGDEDEDDEEDEEDEEAEGEDSDAPPSRASPLLHGPADDETSALPMVASLARILPRCSNLLWLDILQHVEAVTREITADLDPAAMWPSLTRLDFAWSDSFIDVFPILARLSRLQTLTDLTLVFATSNEDNCRDATTREYVEKYPIQPLERLQRFTMRSLPETPIGSKAMLQLLSPRASLRQVVLIGYIPPGVCKQLSYGTTEINHLMFAWLLPTTNLANQLLPQLLELDRRPIKHLILNIETQSDTLQTEDLPPITELLKNLPYGIRFSSASDMGPSSSASDLYRDFPSGGADFAMIKARPMAPVALGSKGEWSGSLDGKPLLQVGVFWVGMESNGKSILRCFGRFGDPDVEGDVTGWRLLEFPDEDRKEE